MISLAVLNGLFASSLVAQTKKSLSKQLKATRFEIKDSETAVGGKLYLIVGGKERKIDDQAF